MPDTLRTIRERAFGSLESASRETGIPRSTLGCWETGTRVPGPESVSRLARAYAVTEDAIRDALPGRRTVRIIVGVSPSTRVWLQSQAQRRGERVGGMLDAMVRAAIRRSA